METEDYALAKQKQERDIIEKGTPNGAKRAAMDKIIASIPKQAWEYFFDKTGT